MIGNHCFVLIKVCLIIIITASMILWAILLVEVLNSLENETQNDMSLSSDPTKININIKEKSNVWYITNTCIPELLAFVGLIAIFTGNQYWSQTSGIILFIFWINDHQRNPELFYYGSPIAISGHALHLSVSILLMIFGFMAHSPNYYTEPSLIVNTSKAPFYLCRDPKHYRY
jgi:hypothetical protein